MTTGPGSVTVDHVNAGRGLETLTVVGPVINATVNIPAFTPGTFNPVVVTFTRINPNLAVNFTLRAASSFNAIFINVQCAAPSDTDDDGVLDFRDNCPTMFNPEKIAFVSQRDGNREIYAVNADGSNPVNLTNNIGSDEEPAFSRNGAKIAFRSTRDGVNEIYVMNADGSNQANLTNNPAYDEEPSWGAQLDSDNDGIGDACENQPPVALCRNVTVTLAPGQTTAAADVNDASFDPDGDPLTLMYNPASPYPVGQTVVTLTVNDGKGGTDSCMGTVTVLYRFKFFNFSDLLIPNNTPNQAEAGSDIPIRFSLSGFKGKPYSSPPVSQRINCITGNPIGAAQAIQTRGGVVNYDPTFDVYQTTWRTQVSWAGTCRRLTLFLKDGTMPSLDFRFQ